LQKGINIVHYWGGTPITPTSKWLRTLKLIEKCKANGMNNWLVLSKKPEDVHLIEPMIEVGCTIVYLPRSKKSFDIGCIYRTFIFLKKIKCDIFHCHNDHTSPIIGAFLANVRVKIWSKLSMSAAYEKNLKLTGIGKLMPSTRITCWCADKVLAISDAVKKELSDQIGFENKIKVINAPVPVEKYLSATGVGIREEFKFKESDLVLVSVGHFAEVKGWDISVQAFVEVRKKIPQSKLLLVGKTTSQSFYNKIITLIKVNGLQDSVVFAGNRSDIPNILKASDMFIFPSRSEGAGAALIEAMAAGIPCIGTNTGGIPSIIENGVNGFLFERENVSDLSKKILDLSIDSELKIQFCTAAEKKLVNFTIESYVEGVFNQYQALLLNR